MHHQKLLWVLGASILLSAGCDDGNVIIQDGNASENEENNNGNGDNGNDDNGNGDNGNGDNGNGDNENGDNGNGDNGNTCENLCREGAKQCSSDGKSQVCIDIDGDGCLEWSEKACPENTVCTNGVCETPDETPECQNECPENGARMCTVLEDGTQGYLLCSNFNDDACLEWSDPLPCSNGKSCHDGHCGCTDACETDGETECYGNGVRTCSDINNDGCLEWSSVTPCDDTCSSGQCTCSHECQENSKQCSGSGYQTCVTDGSGCRRWSGVTPCEHGCESGQCKAPPVVMAPTRYPGNRLLSPVTPYTVKQMKAIRSKNSSRKDLRFIKVGDSHMYSGSVFMYCYSKTGSKGGMNLADATFLQDAIDAFQSDTDCFHRDSLTAVLGKTMSWSLTGNYMTNEINAMNPRFAFVGYGSNDMGWFGYNKKAIAGGNQGYFYSLQWYYRNMLTAAEQLVSNGIIPMFIGTGLRTDQSTLAEQNKPIHYVSMFNAVARGLAEKYQVPYYNLQLSQEPLPKYGLSSDGLHHKHLEEGCTFTESGLAGGANTRNRYAMEMLDRAWRTVIRDEAAPDTETIPFDGSGTQTDPWVISSLPYTHTANSSSGKNLISEYSCSAGTNEAGPELYYRLDLKQTTRIRAFSLSASGVDVDIHLKTSLNDAACITRGDKWIEASLNPGTYYIVVDTYGSANNAGEYLMGVLQCDDADSACGSAITGG